MMFIKNFLLVLILSTTNANSTELTEAEKNTITHALLRPHRWQQIVAASRLQDHVSKFTRGEKEKFIRDILNLRDKASGEELLEKVYPKLGHANRLNHAILAVEISSRNLSNKMSATEKESFRTIVKHAKIEKFIETMTEEEKFLFYLWLSEPNNFLLSITYPKIPSKSLMIANAPDKWQQRRFVIGASTTDYSQAIVKAKELSQKLEIPLNLRMLKPLNTEAGLTSPKTACESYDVGYPCYLPRVDAEGKSVSIEFSSAYIGFEPNFYIVVLADQKLEKAKMEELVLLAKEKGYTDTYMKSFYTYVRGALECGH